MEDLAEFQQLEPNNIVGDLVSFIEDQLPEFPNSSEFIEILCKKKNENQHSLSFCVYMTNRSDKKYYFGRENSQKGSSVIDIGVYLGSVLIFTIEAKLLPTPITDSKRNEFEYVYGKGGGIQRFKDGNHGVDNQDSYLLENGIIAYIKENDFDFWLETINTWILDAKWDKSELLKADYLKIIAKLKSIHSGVNSSEVKLHHFWVNVVSEHSQA